MAKGFYKPNIVSIVEWKSIKIAGGSSSFNAGRGTSFQDGNYFYDIPAVEDIDTSKAYAITINGNSMAPEFMQDDLVILNTQSKLTNGDFVAVCLNGDYIFKIYEPSLYCLYLSSINPEFEPIRVLDTDECVLLGKAIQLIRNV